MIASIFLMIQADDVVLSQPELGVRISIWFIGMFLLAVGGALLYLRMKELQEKRKSGGSTKT